MFRSLKKKVLVVSLVAILTAGIGATFCYLMAETDAIVNLFKPFLHPYGNLKIEKLVEHPFGDVVPENVSFAFEVYSEKGELITTSHKTTEAGQVKIPIGVFSEADLGKTITYKVKEVNDGIVYDGSVFGVTVVIQKDSSGKLIAKVDGDGKTFTNKYDPEDTKAVIKGTKNYEGNELKAEALHSINLSSQKKGNLWQRRSLPLQMEL